MTTPHPLPDDPLDELQRQQWAQADRFALTAALFEGSLAVAAVVLGWALGIDPVESFRWDATAVGVGVAGIAPLLGLLAWSMRSAWRPLRSLRRFFDRSIVPLFRPLSVVQLAVLSILAGVGEELLFRGIVQAGIAHGIGGAIGTAVALLAAGVLFGFAHALSPAYFLLATVIGFCLGAIWLATGNLLTPIVTHAGYDFVALFYLARYRRGQGPSSSNERLIESDAEHPADDARGRS